MRFPASALKVVVGGHILVAASMAAAAPASPADILRRALSGPRVPYSGVQETTVYGENGSSSARVRIWGDGRGGVRRQFETGPASGVVMLRLGQSVWQKQPDGTFARLPSSGDMSADETGRRIMANYHLSARAGEPLLGRKTVLLHIAPRHPFNPSREILVDALTGLILRDVLYAPDGARRSATVFVELSYGKQPPGLFAKPAAVSRTLTGYGPASFEARKSEDEVARETGRAVPRPSYVPAGYEVATFGIVTTGRGLKTPAIRYSDGLSAFTVFVRGGGPGPGLRGGGWGMGGGPRRRGAGGPPWRASGLTATSDRQRAMVTYTSPTASYVLIGDLAEQELARVARSLP